MNHTYKTVFNRSLWLWQALSELARARSKSKAARTHPTVLAASVLAVLLASSPTLAAPIVVNSTVLGGNGSNGSGGTGGTGGLSGMGGGSGGTGGNGGSGSQFADGTPGTAGSGGGVGGQLSGVPGGAEGGGGAGGYADTNGLTGGGGGGGGGSGVVASGSTELTNNSSIVGGNGGNGDFPNGVYGSGGGGGDGVTLTSASGSTIVNNAGATIRGGNGGGGSAQLGAGGSGGDGISLVGDNSVITNAGTIQGGGAAYQGNSSGNAISLTGNNNRLELLSTSSISGKVVVVGSGNVLALIGSANGSFDASTLGSQYQGFTALEKQGSSTWTLTGSSSFNGSIAINAGTLALSGNGSLNSSTGLSMVIGAIFDISAANGSRTIGTLTGGVGSRTELGANRLTVNQATNTTYNGDITGTGELVKQGAGMLTLSGTNTYTGNTTIAAGTLRTIGGSAIQDSSAVAISAGATLDLNGSNETIGSLAGSGSIALGSGVLTTGGNNTSTTFSGGISGIGGSLNKQGSGTLTLSGINTYSGTTVVNTGTLSIAATGSVASNTIVNNGGTLAGTGSVGTLAMNSGGILAPGNSIGTFTVNGNLTFNSGSIYRVEVDAAGASDKTIVNGNVTLAGNVDVRAGAGNYANTTSYTILTHSGTRTGTFSSVTSNLAFLTPTLSYAANAVELNLARNNVSFASVAETRNQRAAASGVERLGPGMVYTAVSGFSAPQAQAAFDALSGTQHAAASQAALNMSRGFSNALMNRAAIAGSRLQGAAGLRYASLDLSGISSLPGLFGSPHQLGRNLSDAAPSTSPLARLHASGGSVADAGIWFQVIGGKGDIEGDGNGSGSDYSSTGFLAGYDAQLNTDWLMGVAVGYGKTQWDADVPATGNVDTPYAAMYGRYTSGPWQVRLNGGYADNRFDTTRTITLGAASSQAQSKHTGKEWSGAVEAEYFLTKAQGWEVRPLAALRYSYLDEDGFTESGSPAALKIRARSTQQANLGLGSRFVRSIDDDNGSLEFKALITHLAGDTDAPVTASFVGSTNTFNVDGTPLKRTALVLGAGVSHRIANKTALFADLGYETRGSGQHNAVAAVGVQYRW